MSFAKPKPLSPLPKAKTVAVENSSTTSTNPATEECLICTEEYSVVQEEWKVMDNCSHKVCKECYTKLPRQVWNLTNEPKRNVRYKIPRIKCPFCRRCHTCSDEINDPSGAEGVEPNDLPPFPVEGLVIFAELNILENMIQIDQDQLYFSYTINDTNVEVNEDYPEEDVESDEDDGLSFHDVADLFQVSDLESDADDEDEDDHTLSHLLEMLDDDLANISSDESSIFSFTPEYHISSAEEEEVSEHNRTNIDDGENLSISSFSDNEDQMEVNIDLPEDSEEPMVNEQEQIQSPASLNISQSSQDDYAYDYSDLSDLSDNESELQFNLSMEQLFEGDSEDAEEEDEEIEQGNYEDIGSDSEHDNFEQLDDHHYGIFDSDFDEHESSVVVSDSDSDLHLSHERHQRFERLEPLERHERLVSLVTEPDVVQITDSDNESDEPESPSPPSKRQRRA